MNEAVVPDLVEGPDIADISARFHQSAAAILRAANSTYPACLQTAAQLIIQCLKSGGKLLVFGNGGSASDAQHLCGELVVRFQTNRRALPAISLCSDSAVLTACGNDLSYQDVFARQIQALGKPGDIAFGITTSGNSNNVVSAFRSAREMEICNMLLTGPNRGAASEYADLILSAPGRSTAEIQELHLVSYHSLCEMIDNAFTERV